MTTLFPHPVASRSSLLQLEIFYITAGLFDELFATHPDSKVIQTGLVLASVVVEREFFLKRGVGTGELVALRETAVWGAKEALKRNH